MYLGLEIQKTNVGIRQNRQLLLFRSKFAQKWILRSKFWKTKPGYRISSCKIPCVPVFRQNGQLLLFRTKLAQKKILGSEFWKTKSGYRISSSKISCVLIFRPNGQLLLFRPKFAQKRILGSEFQNSKSGFGISTSKIYHGCQFSGKMDNFEFSAQICAKKVFGVGISKF